jgi:hypothetical protein
MSVVAAEGPSVRGRNDPLARSIADAGGAGGFWSTRPGGMGPNWSSPTLLSIHEDLFGLRARKAEMPLGAPVF